jgi:hypothetical protein
VPAKNSFLIVVNFRSIWRKIHHDHGTGSPSVAEEPQVGVDAVDAELGARSGTSGERIEPPVRPRADAASVGMVDGPQECERALTGW